MKRICRLFALPLAAALLIGVIMPSSLMALDRYSGEDRYETAAEISRSGWEAGSEVVVLARGDDFADALTGVSLAYMHRAPILLTRPGSLPQATKTEIQRLGAKTVYILGGEGAVSKDVEDELEGLGLENNRIAGANRWETAAKIAREVAPNGVSTAFVVYGLDFPDALAAASYAAAAGYPILLTNTKSIPASTVQVVEELGIENTYVVGGTGVISDRVMEDLPNPERIWGADRFLTAVTLAKKFALHTERMYIATGADSSGGADAIAGAALAAINGTGILLVDGSIPKAVEDILGTKYEAIVLGGPGAVSQKLLEAIDSSLAIPFTRVNGITVASEGDMPEVNDGEALQMRAEVRPSNATNKKVTWSLVNGTGSAIIDDDGMLTGTKIGTVTVKATAKDGSGVVGVKEVTVTTPEKYFTFETGAVTGYDFNGGADVVIPSTIGGDKVTTIGDDAFRYHGLTSVVIPNSVIGIGNRAFQHNSIAVISLGSGLASIGESAFEYNNLTNLVIPDNVTSIGEWAFSDNDLISVEIGDGITALARYTFAWNELNSISFGSNVTTIGEYAFQDNNLETISIPESVRSIEARAFTSNENLTGVDIPDSVTYVGRSAFFGLPEEKIRWKGDSYFTFADDDKKILDGHIGTPSPDLVIPDGVTSINDAAFSWCELTSVEIPDSVTSIGDSAFFWNPNLSTVKMSNSVVTIGDNAFNNTSLGSIELPDGLVSIGEQAFSWSLSSVVIPDSVTSIGKGAFPSLSKESIQFGSGYSSFFAFSAEGSLEGYIGKPEPVLVIPEGTIAISARAFYGQNLTSVSIPGSVSSIGDSAFAFNDLTTVSIPEGVISLGSSAFTYNNLTSVSISEGVTSIGSLAFANNNLTSVTVPASVTRIGKGAFAGLGEDSIELKGTTGYFAYSEDGSVLEGHIGKPDSDLKIPEGVTSISAQAFTSNGLTRVKIPASVTSIGEGAFQFNDLNTIEIGADGVNLGHHLLSNQIHFRTAYNRGGAGKYTGTQLGDWIKMVPAAGVSIGQTELYLKVGGSTSLAATVTPENAINKDVVWSTSDGSVATVVDGRVTAVGRGTTTVSVATADGNHTATCAITVLLPAAIDSIEDYNSAAPGSVDIEFTWNDSQTVVTVGIRRDWWEELSGSGENPDYTVQTSSDGSSATLTISQPYLDNLSLEAGDEIELRIRFEGVGTVTYEDVDVSILVK